MPFKLEKGNKFHFIAMGGVGQSALAKILVQLGFEVSGSDINDSKYLKELKELGAKVYIGHDKKNVPEGAYIVLSSAIKEDNPELIRAREMNLTVLHRSDLLLAITKEFPLTVGFSGTHGKTTTSGLASYVLSKIGAKAAYAVGGIISGLNTNANAKKDAKIFVAELDESDGTISKYTPEILVINNLEADHPDFYKNGLQDVLNTFKNLILKLQNTSKVIVNSDDKGICGLFDMLCNLKTPEIIKFSVFYKDKGDDTADFAAKNVVFNSNGAEFDVIQKGKLLGRLSISLKGIHNVYNALSVCAALIVAGFNFNEFAPFFKGFSGMGRRFQQVFKNETVEIIDDYAHHPSEIKATLKAAKEYAAKAGKKRITAFFQPHRYTRLKALFNDFLEAFDDTDMLVTLDVFSAGDMKDPEFNSKTFVGAFKKKYPSRAENAVYIEGKIDEIPNKVIKYIKDGDIVLTLGAGDITKLGKLIGEKL